MSDNKVQNKGYGLMTIANFLLYLFFVSVYIKDETAPWIKVVPLYILAFTLLIITYLLVKNTEDKKRRRLYSLIIFAAQFGLGLFLTIQWFEPGSDFLLAHPMWLTHLKILASLHYVSGFMILFKTFFNTL